MGVSPDTTILTTNCSVSGVLSGGACRWVGMRKTGLAAVVKLEELMCQCFFKSDDLN